MLGIEHLTKNKRENSIEENYFPFFIIVSRFLYKSFVYINLRFLIRL